MSRKKTQQPATEKFIAESAKYLGENIVEDVISRPKGKADNERISVKAKQEVEQSIAMQQQRDKTYKLEFVLGTWKETQEYERKLKQRVANIVFALLGLEVLVGNTAFFFYGFGLINVPEWVAQTFYVGMYVQVIGIVTIVVRSLFPKPKSDTLTELNRMVDKL